MLERLDFWLAIFTLGALAYFELRLSRFIGPIVRGIVSIARPAAQEVKRRASRQLPTNVRLRTRPIRDNAGRFNGSLPAVPIVPNTERPFPNRSASERDVPDGNDVSSGTISPHEAALIGLRLGRGISPSDVAKSLPGYSARKYQMFMGKVVKVQTDLAQFDSPAEFRQDDGTTAPAEYPVTADQRRV